MKNDVTVKDAPIQGAFRIDEAQVRGHVDKLVRQSVEQTLNSLLEAEAKQLCGADKYERTDASKDTRAGSYHRKLHTKAGEVTLKVPRLRSLPFETQIIERYKRRESSVEESLIEMYFAPPEDVDLCMKDIAQTTSGGGVRVCRHQR